jgi:hypothetical protein
MKWCGIAQAPSVADPTLVCQNPGDFKTMMWRRHERASDCIWIQQCQLTLRSGGAIQSSDYKSFADLDTSIGTPGDIVISPITEMDNTWMMCDTAWQPQPKGAIAISAKRLLDNTGAVVARGVAYQGSITRPWLAVADPTVYCQLNERSLAHEAGHVLSLPHVASGLMQTGGAGATLTLAECNQARTYLQNNTILDPPAQPSQRTDLVDYVFDERGDSPRGMGFLDINKVVATDNSASGGDLSFCIGTEGLVSTQLPTLGRVVNYWIALDADNNPKTGGDPAALIPGTPIKGVEFIAQVSFDLLRKTTTAALYEVGEFGRFVPVLLPPGLITAAIRTINLVICDPEKRFHGPTVIPKFSEIDFKIANKAFEFLGLPQGGRLFPRGLMLQAVSSVPSTQFMDMAPDKGGVLKFPEIHFPSVAVPAQITRGQFAPVAVQGMPPGVKLMVFLGQFKIEIPDMVTNDQGQAEFRFLVPANAPTRRTLLTVGIPDPRNAITADTIVEVVGPRP